MRWGAGCLLAAALWLNAASGLAQDVRNAEAVPQLPPAGRDDYRRFLSSSAHRAFAIAPGGTWAWKAEAGSGDEAGEAALEACGAHTRQKCVLYAVDDRVAFDARAWPGLWGPYKGAAQASKVATGSALGERFPDLAFADAKGRRASVAALRGKVTVLHFWGSWCGPCRHEMPDLQKLYEAIKGRKDIAFVLLQVRERYETSRQWADRQGLRLPLYDSGSGGEEDAQFTLSGGTKLKDRDVAARFPTTYVLDKHGLVLFSHVGPVHGWKQYEPFLLDAAKRSGK